MTGFIISLAAIVAFGFSTYGWGRLVVHATYRAPAGSWPYNIVLGLAYLVTIGGILNATRMAYPGALLALLGIGFIIAASFLYVDERRNSAISSQLKLTLKLFSQQRSIALDDVVISSSVVFLIVTLMPSSTFNFHDDFHKYLFRPVSMLQTGTLGGNPFDALGIDSLGAQSFLQAFVLLAFPLEYINAFDAIFCFALSAFLLREVGRKLRTPWGYVTLALLLLIIINPQYVNITALYSGTATILGLLLACCALTDSGGSGGSRLSVYRAVPVGLLLATLIALKSTFIFFAGFYFLAFFAFHAWFYCRSRQAIRVSLVSAGVAAVALLPWVALYSLNYAAVFLGDLPEGAPAGDGWPTFGYVTFLFAFGELGWGGDISYYNYIIVLLVLISLFSAYLLHKGGGSNGNRFLVITLSSSVAAIGSYLGSGYFFDPPNAVRFACPVFLAVLPAAVVALGRELGLPVAGLFVQRDQWSVRPVSAIFVALHVVLVVMFWDVFADRVVRAEKRKTLLSWDVTETHVQYTQVAFDRQSKESALKVQALTDPNDTILAWIAVPFHLNFVRNRILAVSEAGLTAPWLGVTQISSEHELRDFLRRYGVRYVMWEYGGTGLKQVELLEQYRLSPSVMHRKIGESNLHFGKMLVELANNSEIIYRTDRIVMFDIGDSD